MSCISFPVGDCPRGFAVFTGNFPVLISAQGITVIRKGLKILTLPYSFPDSLFPSNKEQKYLSRKETCVLPAIFMKIGVIFHVCPVCLTIFY